MQGVLPDTHRPFNGQYMCVDSRGFFLVERRALHVPNLMSLLGRHIKRPIFESVTIDIFVFGTSLGRLVTT